MSFEQLIIEKGFKPSSFHKEVNLERQSVLSYRKGTSKPSAKTLKKLADKLNTSVDEILECFN